jgi:hypothetical protein
MGKSQFFVKRPDFITPERTLMVFAAIAFFVGLAASINAFQSIPGFWEDEFYQVTFANEPFSKFVFAVARLDVHPFFHYLQLKFWAEFFPSDKGLLANSLFWHFVSCCVIFYVGSAWRSLMVGLLAVAFYVLVPQVVWASATLRMYTLIPALAVSAWWLNVRVLTKKSVSNKEWLGILAIELALAYSHAIAFFFVPWIALAAVMQVFDSRRNQVPWRQWFILQGIVGLLLLPLAIMAAFRTGIPGNRAPVDNIVFVMGAMLAGWGMKSLLIRGVAAAFYGAVVILGLRDKSNRPLTIWLLLGPLVAGLTITFLVAPMFKVPVYASILMPFMALVLASALVQLHGVVRYWLSVSLLVVLTLAVFPTTEMLFKDRTTNPWELVAQEVKARTVPGDVVIIPKAYEYWAVLRYAVGLKWGAPSEVLPAPNERWIKLVNRLGPALSDFLGLLPKTNQIESAGVTYVIGEEAVVETRGASHVWVINSRSYTVPVSVADGYGKSVLVWQGEQGVELHKLDRAGPR